MYCLSDTSLFGYEHRTGLSDVPNAEVVDGDLVTRPADDPENGDKIFTGWYEDETCEVPFDFDH